MFTKFLLVIFILCTGAQAYFPIIITSGFVSALLTAFSIFFGFYLTSFAVFSSSSYVGTLYQIQDPNNSSLTLLHNLISEFKCATYIILSSIVYLVIVALLIDNTCVMNVCSKPYVFYLIWGIIAVNIGYAFKTIMIFIDFTFKSAANQNKN